MKAISLIFTAIVSLLFITSSAYADGLFRTCGKGNCTMKNVKGEGNNICLKLPKGCCIINKEHSTQKKIFKQLKSGSQVSVDTGTLVLCGVGNFHGTKNGTVVRDKKSGKKIKYNAKLKKFGAKKKKEARLTKKWGMVAPKGCYWECKKSSGCLMSHGATASKGMKMSTDTDKTHKNPGWKKGCE